MLQDLFIYELKVITCSGLLLLYYRIALRNRRFHYYNRFYLLSTILLGMVLPLMHLEWFTLNTNSSKTIHVFNIINSTAGEEINFASGSSFSWQQVLLYTLLLIGAMMMLTLF